jgi:hypothetical protein
VLLLVATAVTTHHSGLLYCEGILSLNRQRPTEGKGEGKDPYGTESQIHRSYVRIARAV